MHIVHMDAHININTQRSATLQTESFLTEGRVLLSNSSLNVVPVATVLVYAADILFKEMIKFIML